MAGKEINHLFIPDSDQIIYLGFHFNTEQGYGGFLDDIKIDNWGTVGINQDETVSSFYVYSSVSGINIVTDETWQNANVRVINLIGQTVHADVMNTNSKNIPLSIAGMYIVTMEKNGETITKKILFQ